MTAQRSRMSLEIYVIGIGGLVAPFTAHAQSTTDATSQSTTADTSIADIIVTAQRREQALNDVGISLVAVSGKDLVAKGVVDTQDLPKIVPSLTAAPTGFGNTVLTLRGIGFYESSLASTSPVAIYQDEAPIPFTRMAVGTTLDLQRVEVLKGPQGTLYGSNTTGGLVNFVTNRPTDRFEAGIDASLGRFMDTDVQGFVSGPISDTLGFRVALRSDQSDGWQKSVTRDDTLGAKRLIVGRVLLEWRPSDRLRFEFSANGFIDHSDTQALAATSFRPNIPALATPAESGATLTPPGNDRLADWDPGKQFRNDNHDYRLALKSTVGLWEGADLIAISSYQRFDQNSLLDGDGTDAESAAILQQGYAKSFAQEVRVQGKTNSLTYVLGGNYSHDDVYDDVTILNKDASITRVIPGLFYEQLGFANRQKVKTYPFIPLTQVCRKPSKNCPAAAA